MAEVGGVSTTTRMPAGYAAESRKTCRRCGVSVARVRRMRDRAGAYWCYACGKADSERKHGPRAIIPCPRCGKGCRRRDMVGDGGLHLCQTCGYDRALKTRELGQAAVDLEQPGGLQARRRIRAMLAAVGGLLLVSLYCWGAFGA
jgi:predicted RNA-binding Zn-ribbon protein involved in translation (DUF1610 family)